MMFIVRVADNFHHMDKDETYTYGEFDTWVDAVAAARRIVDLCLAEYSQPRMTPDELYTQ